MTSRLSDHDTPPSPTGLGGVEYPALDEAGMPLDRTVCPRCLGLDAHPHDCEACERRPVCPTCRNARLVRGAGEGTSVHVCPDCAEPITDEDGRVERGPTGVPRFRWLPTRQMDAVGRYRASRAARPRPAPAPVDRDPWHGYPDEEASDDVPF